MIMGYVYYMHKDHSESIIDYSVDYSDWTLPGQMMIIYGHSSG